MERMDHEELERVFEDQVTLCRSVLISKGQQYSSSDDRLHNFRVSAALQDISMHKALCGMMAKHTVSIYDLCSYPIAVLSKEIWEEKITDHLNYLFLLRAIIEEMYSDVPLHRRIN